MSSEPTHLLDSPAESAESLTAVVLTRDEERHLPDCLRSLSFVGRLLVLDSGSRDATCEIAEAAGAEVATHPFENYSKQRQHAIGLVDSPWLLFVDADERIPAELAEEILRIVQRDESGIDGYWIPRRNLFWGRALEGSGWWPDHQLRLFRPEKASYDPERAVHEVAQLEGSAGYLKTAMTHINYESKPEFRAKQRDYALLEAKKRLAAGHRPRSRNFVLQPLREIHRRLVTWEGLRDGPLGLWLALHMAYYEWLTLRYLARLRRPGPNPDR